MKYPWCLLLLLGCSTVAADDNKLVVGNGNSGICMADRAMARNFATLDAKADAYERCNDFGKDWNLRDEWQLPANESKGNPRDVVQCTSCKTDGPKPADGFKCTVRMLPQSCARSAAGQSLDRFASNADWEAKDRAAAMQQQTNRAQENRQQSPQPSVNGNGSERAEFRSLPPNCVPGAKYSIACRELCPPGLERVGNSDKCVAKISCLAPAVLKNGRCVSPPTADGTVSQAKSNTSSGGQREPPAPPAKVKTLATTTACGSVPDGWIRTGNIELNNCKGWKITRFENAPVGTTLQVCNGEQVPKGWVSDGYAFGHHCNEFSYSSDCCKKVIRRLD